MKTHTITSHRAGTLWLGALIAALLALPWYKGQPLYAGPGTSALAEALGGHGWLWPMLASVGALALFATRPKWQASQAALYLTIAAIFLYLWQAFAVGLRGPAADWVGGVFPDALEGQLGLGWGGFIAGAMLVGLLSDIFAARGFCRGERFASLAITGIVTALTAFVFLPIIKLGLAAFIDTDGNGLLSSAERSAGSL